MKAFDYSLVKDPQYFCDNRMEAHSDHVYYRDGNEMQTAVQDGTETSFRYSLNGLWKFHYARNYKSAVQGFEKEDYCCYDWDDIHVPAHILPSGYVQVHGYHPSLCSNILFFQIPESHFHSYGHSGISRFR